MTKTEKIEYYTIKPNLKQLFGRKVRKDLEFDEKTEDGKVHQVLKDCVLITTRKDKTESFVAGAKEKLITEEETKIVQTIPEGVVLIWTEMDGYIIPDLQITTLDELAEDIETIQGIYNECRGEENEIKGDES